MAYLECIHTYRQGRTVSSFPPQVPLPAYPMFVRERSRNAKSITLAKNQDICRRARELGLRGFLEHVLPAHFNCLQGNSFRWTGCVPSKNARLGHLCAGIRICDHKFLVMKGRIGTEHQSTCITALQLDQQLLVFLL